MNEQGSNPPYDRAANGETVMDCTQFRDIVHDLGRQGSEADALREKALAHAASCPGCAQLLRETELLEDALHALAVEAGRLAAPDRVETALVAEFRRRKAALARHRTWRRVAVMGIAAAVLLGLGLSMSRWSARWPTTREVTLQPPSPSPSLAPSETAAPGETAVAADASDFVLLPYGADSEAAGEGTVVRVLLSRASLASLGVSLTGLGNQESVLADLVLSEDGTPQAIRLVSEETAAQEF